MEARLIYKRGNLFTGYPFGVLVEEQFGSSELHGPFSGENEAWNYGMALAKESDGTQSFHIVKIETPHLATIVTAEDVRKHRQEVARDNPSRSSMAQSAPDLPSPI